MECAREGGKCAELGCGATLSEPRSVSAPGPRRPSSGFLATLAAGTTLIVGIGLDSSWLVIPAVAVLAVYLPRLIMTILRRV